MALLVEVTFFSEETNEVKKKKLLVVSDSLSSYEAERLLDSFKEDVLENEYPGHSGYARYE